MKTTLEPTEASVSPKTAERTSTIGTPAWEYCFLLQEQWSKGAELTQLASSGWVVVSFRLRLDNQREYLLKRPRR